MSEYNAFENYINYELNSTLPSREEDGLNVRFDNSFTAEVLRNSIGLNEAGLYVAGSVESLRDDFLRNLESKFGNKLFEEIFLEPNKRDRPALHRIGSSWLRKVLNPSTYYEDEIYYFPYNKDFSDLSEGFKDDLLERSVICVFMSQSNECSFYFFDQEQNIVTSLRRSRDGRYDLSNSFVINSIYFPPKLSDDESASFTLRMLTHTKEGNTDAQTVTEMHTYFASGDKEEGRSYFVLGDRDVKILSPYS